MKVDITRYRILRSIVLLEIKPLSVRHDVIHVDTLDEDTLWDTISNLDIKCSFKLC
jgi:hypothetical protein